MAEEDKAVDQPATTTTVDDSAADNTAAETDTEGATTDDNQHTSQQGDNQQAPDGKDDFVGETPKELEPFKKEILKKYYEKTRVLAEEKHNLDNFKRDA